MAVDQRPGGIINGKMWVFILSFKTREKMVGENFDEKTRRFSSLPSGMQGRYGFPM
ncbi:hypothetical protein CICLE_v10023585mg [Citrus x clementina]|uniref:Uncharacterized protein n=1 Tax=Citrus clementina TaxID=85681 RepID=V4U7E6_CITCL|nr:hypothetical protein CICLE_v10023585mg [Citrus x clementina]